MAGEYQRKRQFGTTMLLCVENGTLITPKKISSFNSLFGMASDLYEGSSIDDRHLIKDTRGLYATRNYNRSIDNYTH